MAKPELEDGYTQIEHEVLERLARTSLAPNQWRVLIFIIRKTCGWHKEVDYIANFQIVEGTGLCKAVVSRCLKGLSDLQLITRKGKSIGFQKDWEKWGELAEPSTPDSKLAAPSTLSLKLAVPSTPLDNKSKQDSQQKLAISSTELAESSTKVSSCAVTQKIKDTITKNTIQKIGGPSPQGLGAQTPASKYLFEKTGRKRWQNLVQKEQFEKAEVEVGFDRMKEAIEWALTSGISNIKSIITAARREKHGEPRADTRARGADSARGRDRAPSREEYLRSLEK